MLKNLSLTPRLMLASRATIHRDIYSTTTGELERSLTLGDGVAKCGTISGTKGAADCEARRWPRYCNGLPRWRHVDNLDYSMVGLLRDF